MTTYTTITDWSFQFGDHPHCTNFVPALNNTYSEDIEPAAVSRVFTNNIRTIIAVNVITVLQTTVIDTILVLFRGNYTVVALIVNQMLLFGYFGNPAQKFPILSAGIVTTVLNTNITANKTAVIIVLNMALIFVDCNNFNVMDFTGLSLTGPVCHINAPTAPGIVGEDEGAGTATGATPPTAAQVVAAAAVTANDAN